MHKFIPNLDIRLLIGSNCPAVLGRVEVVPRGNREFKQIATACATTAAVTEKVWGEHVLVVCQILEIQRCQKRELKSLKSILFSFSQSNGFTQRTVAFSRLARTSR